MKCLYCCVVLVVLLGLTLALAAADVSDNAEEVAPIKISKRMFVQTLTCTSPNCNAQCRGRGYRNGKCQIGRCFCSYV
uniref:Putative conserved secreted protein n=1 Tax=Culex tarsalis TaxID=7177 RepID=A0A1Q3FTD4_CULTA